MTQAQKDYLFAKARAVALESELNNAEAAYCKDNDCKDATGTIVKHVWQIDDEDMFNYHNLHFCNERAIVKLCNDEYEAHKALRKAEESLIAEGLEYARKYLPKEAKAIESNLHNYAIREKFIELALKVNYQL